MGGVGDTGAEGEGDGREVRGPGEGCEKEEGGKVKVEGMRIWGRGRRVREQTLRGKTRGERGDRRGIVEWADVGGKGEWEQKAENGGLLGEEDERKIVGRRGCGRTENQ